MKLLSVCTLTVLAVAVLVALTHAEGYGAGGGYGTGYTLVPAYGYGGFGGGVGGGVGGGADSWICKYLLLFKLHNVLNKRRLITYTYLGNGLGFVLVSF